MNPVKLTSCRSDPCIPNVIRLGVLTEADLSTLVNLLIGVAEKWDAVCLQLGVPMSKIRNITANPMLLSRGPRGYLQEGLYEWLHGGSPCTASALCTALREDSVDEAVLASRVQTELNNRGQ